MDKLEGLIAYLPDGQKVSIEYVAEGLATVMRLDGQWRGKIAVCAVTSLIIPTIIENPDTDAVARSSTHLSD
jgi:hypothetical protein